MAKGFHTLPEKNMNEVIEKGVEKKDVVRSKLDKLNALREKGDLCIPSTKLQRDMEIEGYTLCWFNDQNNRLAEKLKLGWEFVRKNEIPQSEGVVPDEDVADRISRYAGKDETGKSYRTYLMKIENEVYVELMKITNGIAERALNTINKVEDGQYVPKQHGISITRA